MLILLQHVTHDHTEPSTARLSITDQLKWPLLGIVMVPLQRASMWHRNTKVSEVTHENWWGQTLILSSGMLLTLIKAHFNVLDFCEDWVSFYELSDFYKWFIIFRLKYILILRGFFGHIEPGSRKQLQHQSVFFLLHSNILFTTQLVCLHWFYCNT